MIRILQQDNRLTKAIFALIIGAAIITMVITLVPGIFDNGANSNPAVFATIHTPGIFGKIVGESQQVQMADVQRQTMQQIQQQHLPEQYAPLLVGRIGQQQVERKVLALEADRLGLQVSDEDLRSFMQKGTLSQYIFPGGKFIGTDQYTNFVQQYFQISVPEFEAEVKSDLELQRLQSLVTAGVTVSDAAVRADYMQQGTKVKFDYAVIAASDIKKTINPSDADLQAFFKQFAARYATAIPETRKLELFSFDASNIPGGKPQVSDADVQAYYNAHLDQYKVPEQVKTRHILITVAKGADAKTDAAAKAKAEDILKQIRAGGNFADLAKKNSDDPGSKDQGGELPLMPTSGFVPEYSKAAMALNPGQTSDLVRSQFGYHIIQTEQKEAAHTKTLAETKDTIVPLLQQQKAGAAELNFANQLAAEAKKNGMQKTADAHSLHLVTTDYIGHDGVIASLADSSNVLTQAFGVAKGAAPATASTGEGYAVFQVDDIKAAHAPDFADYKPHILDDYREQKAPELLNSQLIKLADRAKVLNDLKKAAAEMNVPVKTSDLVGRDAQVPDLGALTGPASVVFSLPKGGISGPINEGPNGSVIQLADKQEPTADDIAKNLPTSREKLLNVKREEIFNVFVGSLMDKYEKAGAIVYSTKQPASPFGGR
ncbi:peptidylprolyl isomerase [Granulicella mallensis]|jgi:peptidyl-prolyl cis-trans isomerase D|uniref:Periplasmic chaperone PpiD n=1 Tax=Granulicella mallensis TaxID=940614 RepID=A0A7W8EB67_9BACT|nr:peptidyl-prolyl cis-trans isomerase [Granulicella mallensis]MBB5065522.1 peptidyl-prolyl cis-trans isomerase D [Granulicella mallensis]